MRLFEKEIGDYLYGWVGWSIYVIGGRGFWGGGLGFCGLGPLIFEMAIFKLSRLRFIQPPGRPSCK